MIPRGGWGVLSTLLLFALLQQHVSAKPEVSQSTTPEELPVVGDPFSGEIGLSLNFPRGPAKFALNGKRLQLLQPLDRDKDNLSHIIFQLACTVRATQKKRAIPVIVRVSDINDNAPQFIGTPYHTTVSEYSVVPGNDIESSTEKASDTNGPTKVADGYGFFVINLPHQGQITVNRSLDYERTQRYLVTVVASTCIIETDKINLQHLLML
ncbi:hypothetical protein J437_LFUL001994 [Ladona fulva]|uniref:Cadherin domain-containing protein n=1 Tax=Ladona fulva TaxID=123851 RepID=A0A8K0JWW6_LADFU|nr:hypothetical protein J437_LFUL001994 [Ladona fulva]